MPKPWEKYGTADPAAAVWEWLARDLLIVREYDGNTTRAPRYLVEAVERAYEAGYADHGECR